MKRELADPGASDRVDYARPWPAGLLLAYPPEWRARYGDELELLIADLRNSGRQAVPMAADLLRGAAAAWVNERRIRMSERSRGALITVLWSWVAFAALAAWFGHDLGVQPNSLAAAQIALKYPAVPDAYHVLLAAGIVGIAATAIAAVPFAVEAARDAWSRRRYRTFVLMAIPPVAAAVWLGGLHLLPGGSATAGRLAASVTWLLLGVAGIAGSTQAVCTIIRSTEFSTTTWRIGATCAVAVSAAMLVATSATIAWGMAFRLSQTHPGDASGWLTVMVAMAAFTTRAVIALTRTKRPIPAPATAPPPA